MTITHKISPRVRTDRGESWTVPARERPFDRGTGKYPDGTLDITHLSSSDRIGILQQQFPEGLRDKIYFVLVSVESAGRDDMYDLWAEATTYEGRTVCCGLLLDEPVEYGHSVVDRLGLDHAADMITVRRAKVTDEFIATVALML